MKREKVLVILTEEDLEEFKDLLSGDVMSINWTYVSENSDTPVDITFVSKGNEDEE